MAATGDASHFCSNWLAVNRDINKLVLMSGHDSVDWRCLPIHVTVGKREAQVPADRKQDHLGFKLAPLGTVRKSIGHGTSEHLSSPLIRSSLQSCNTANIAALTALKREPW